jgi:transcriptional regulator GlxA family with amidase domain
MAEALTQRTIAFVLFEGFTVLDVYGPLQAFAMAGQRQPDGTYHRFFKILTVAPKAGPVRAGEGPAFVADHGFDDLPECDLILIPGGMGTRKLVDDAAFVEQLASLSNKTPLTTTVCTGSGLLARTGLLDKRAATSNKMAWEWVQQQGEAVDWVRKARWVDDGNIVTSSGVSAGIDMALAVIARLHGRETSVNAARAMEYIWNDDPGNDPFA